MRCVVFGATGYIGGRLVPELVRTGQAVRAAARDVGKLAEVPWRDSAELVSSDVTDAASVAAAVADQEVVYYLVHSLHRRDFVDLDRTGAQIVARAARAAGVERIVYLGGITPAERPLSDHLASRDEVARILLDSGVPTVVLRAAIILGS
ncbi:MAG TPA: NAD(P)H-binding protein, partial [Actinomycetes bacterium]